VINTGLGNLIAGIDKLGGLVATDYTPVNRRYDLVPSNQPLQGSVVATVAEDQSADDGAIMACNSFDAGTVNALAAHGVVSGKGTGNKFFNLEKGKVLFAPQTDIDVKTHEANVLIAANSLVWIVETGNDVSILDLSDTHSGAVKVVNGNNRIDLVPGRGVVLTKVLNGTFEDINPMPDVSYRNLTSSQFGSGTKAVLAEYSLVSALNNVATLRNLRTSKDKTSRRLAAKLLRDAAILSLVLHSPTPYKTNSPLASAGATH
jgi:hypothetical protein